MNNAEWRQVKDAVASRFELLTFEGPDEFTRKVVADRLDKLRDRLNLPSYEAGEAVGELLSVVYELGTHRVDELAGDLPPPPHADAGTGALMTVFHDLVRKLGTAAPVPPNLYRVAQYGTGVWLANVPNSQVNKDNALNLAVWIVALVDPELKAFAPLLAKVLQR